MSGTDELFEGATVAVLEDALQAEQVVRRDRPGGRPGQHDLDVRLAAGDVAVEVTRSTEPALRRFDAADDSPWEAPELEHTWWLVPDGLPRLRPLQARSVDLLRQLERAEVVLVERSLGGVCVEELADGRVRDAGPAATELLDLGVDWGRHAGSGPGRVHVMFPTMGTFENPSAVTDAVEVEAPPNADKLARASAHASHLFVWLELDKWSAWVGLRSRRPSDARPPALPDAIDEVWAATLVDVDGGHELIVWRAQAGERWRSVPVSAETVARVAELLHAMCGHPHDVTPDARHVDGAPDGVAGRP